MNPNFLDFEQPIAELEARIVELRANAQDSAINIEAEIRTLQQKIALKSKEIFNQLTPWQTVQLSRHPLRPHALDYIPLIFSEFHELAGDRSFADDAAIVGGLARIDGQAVMVLGQQKGRDTKQKVKRNFAMPRPEGYRKALRLMQMAERFRLPLLTFIDTPGAYPGIGAEERNQSEAIARNLLVMSELNVPIIATVIGEGGSGGALAIGVSDITLMLQYATYSVITPEGCASILWKSADRARDAAEAMGMTSDRLKALGLIDAIVPEPLGGAHRNTEAIAATLKSNLLTQLKTLCAMSDSERAERRYKRLRAYGASKAA
jgi:acetyl-CoA carboxylase carboxyl transferase subunit alpha